MECRRARAIVPASIDVMLRQQDGEVTAMTMTLSSTWVTCATPSSLAQDVILAKICRASRGPSDTLDIEGVNK